MTLKSKMHWYFPKKQEGILDKDIALAIRYAVDNGAKVINGSFGKSYSSMPKEVHDAILYAQENDVLFVHAAGNSAENQLQTILGQPATDGPHRRQRPWLPF